MYHLRRLVITAICLSVLIFLIWLLPSVLNPAPPNKEQQEANERWVETSPYWLDRQACRWFSLCGVAHLKSDPPALKDTGKDDDEGELRLELRSLGDRGAQAIPETRGSSNQAGDATTLRPIPEYVLKYAPLVHLYSKEYFWPSDIADHVKHMLPYADDNMLNNTPALDLDSLQALNSEDGFVYLKSKDDVESRPAWLHSRPNEPVPFSDDGMEEYIETPDENMGDPFLSEDSTWYEVDRDHPLERISDPRKVPGTGYRSNGRPRSQRPVTPRGIQVPRTPQHKPDESGYSKAPATLVLVDKGSGIVDAFWFFFYAYNLGQTVLGVRYGNHVGDWEHAMVRFESGIPRAVFFSEHEGGQAYAWSAVEKRGNATTAARPVIYSAVGSHAMYATPGNHPYVLPFGMLKDVSDKGPLWDPAKNIRSYWYDYKATGDAEGLEPTEENPDAPTNWFHYKGPWGDRVFGLNDVRQWRLFGQYHYVTGPQGPKFKSLDRERVCQTWKCRIFHSIEEGRKKSWH